MLILAHRGASRDAPENTLRAFNEAFAQHAHGLELDTYQVARDIMVFHDRWLHRTTNGNGRVADQTVAMLRTLDAGWGERIPFLRDVLAMVPARSVMNIEIKHLHDVPSWLGEFDEGLHHSVLTTDDIIISSFNHRWLHEIKQHRPAMRIGALTANYALSGPQFAVELGAYSLHVTLDMIEEEYVREAHQAGLKVMVYTVDMPEDMLMLKSWGVDGIFTNVPAIARATLGGYI